jgi:hypothetical protein
VSEFYRLLRCDMVQSCRMLPTFRRILLLPFSGQKMGVQVSPEQYLITVIVVL